MTNNQAAVTSSENASEMTDETPQPHEPHIQVLKGQPTDEELAALIAVLGGVGAANPTPSPSALAGGFRWTGCVLRCPTTSG